MIRFFLRMIFTSAIISAILFTTLYLLPQEYYKTGISWLVYKQTGSQLTIKGDIGFTPLSDNVLTLNDTDFLQTLDEHAKLTINFDKIIFRRSGMMLDTIILSDTDVSYADSLINTTFKIFDINADIGLPIQGKPLDIEGDLYYKGQKIDYQANVKDPEAIKNGGKTDVQVKVSTPFIALDYNGIHSKKSKEGVLKTKISSLRGLNLWLTGSKKLGGSGTIDTHFDIQDDNISTLNGKISIAFYNLTQNYTDPGLKQLIKQLTGNSPEITELTATLNIKNGIVYNDDMKSVGPAKFTGKGQLNLVNKTINYRIVPEMQVSGVQHVPQLSLPITITGSIYHPQITVEIQDIVKEIIKKPEQIIKTLENIATDNAAGKQIKKDLQNLRDSILKNPQLQQQLLEGLLGGGQ